MKNQLPPGLSALLEVVVMFLPAIPAYIWLWPNVHGTSAWIAESCANLYAIAGSLVIGLRRWDLDQLGVNRRGLWLSLACGAAILVGRTLVILSVDWGLPPPQFSLLRLVGDFIFYFALVGVGQELLFRGLIYRALEDWRGTRWAIWISSLGFGLWHIGGGPLMIAATALYGVIFAVIRWRAGGILGLVLVHGLMDYAGGLLLPSTDVVGLGRAEVPHPVWLFLGLAMILLTPIYLWKIYPGLGQFLRHRMV
ncbi:MAG TPA: CPBP family intramembrane glutamic endopeptidase [Anaerolineaceae bacterium]|nr:CPBP family intramembrane glutamic endopeptidase [Anaerolineaceae bacterium]